VRVEAVDRAEEADNAGLDELGLIDPRMAAILARDRADRRHVDRDETIALPTAAVRGSDNPRRCERLWTALRVVWHGHVPFAVRPEPGSPWMVVSPNAMYTPSRSGDATFGP